MRFWVGLFKMKVFCKIFANSFIYSELISGFSLQKYEINIGIIFIIWFLTLILCSCEFSIKFLWMFYPQCTFTLIKIHIYYFLYYFLSISTKYIELNYSSFISCHNLFVCWKKLRKLDRLNDVCDSWIIQTNL